MHPFYDNFLERLTSFHQGCLAVINGLDPDALDWIPMNAPTTEMNSISVIITHLVGAERYWIGDVALGDHSGRVRAEEFRVHGLGSQELIHKINGASEYARNAMQKLSIDDLSRKVTSTRDEKEFAISWALLHALGHTALHLGHLQLVRQLWDERAKV